MLSVAYPQFTQAGKGIITVFHAHRECVDDPELDGHQVATITNAMT